MPVLCQLVRALLMLCVACGRPSTASEAMEVPEPFNVTVNSYNLNTTLHWDYNRLEITPYFNVEILDKVEKNWMAIETCQNILHHFCDLSDKIIDPVKYYKVRVIAFVGPKTSNSSTIEFSLSKVGILGPPELDVYTEKKVIVVDIFHPEVPHELEGSLDHGRLKYIVYYGNNTWEATECSDVCTVKISISNEGTYCFSAQGVSDYFLGMTMEKSEESCINVAEVPEPFNLTVNSYNLNTTLRWDYNKMEITPYFSVEILDKVKMNWMVIKTCQNILYHYCDLSHEIIEPVKYYKVRVKAFVGSETSNASTIEFSLSSVGILGPPELDVYTNEKVIVVDIFHPEVPLDLEGRLEHERLRYRVYYKNDAKEASKLDSSAWRATYSFSDDGTYCFSAQGVSDYFVGMTMMKSKESCINVAEGISNQTVGIIIGVTVAFVVILAISTFIITRWTKARNLMPQSLSSIVRNIVSYVQMPTQPTPRYDNVSTSPIESPVEEITYTEEKVKIDSDISTDSVSKESSDPGYQSSLTENEQKTDERGDDQSNSSSYFHTDSSSSGLNPGDTTESEKYRKVSENTPEPPKDIKPLSNSFGYDKPHFPKELF